MNRYLSITFRTFTIWVMAAVINAVLCGIYIGLIDEMPQRVVPMIIICGICSLIFSIPGFFVFWIVMLIAISRYFYQRALFRIALSSGFILSAITGVASVRLFRSFYHGDWFLFPVFIIFSAITSIMMHFNLFKKIRENTVRINF